MNDRIWYLRNCNLLNKLSASQMHEIERVSQFRVFETASPIYLPSHPADSLLLVAKGLVKICHLNLDGKIAILAFVRPGELFGEFSLFDAEQRGEYAEAAEPTSVVRIPRESLQEIMQTNAEMAVSVSKMIGIRRKRIENRLRNLLFASNQQRLVHLLLDLADQFGIVVEEGIKLGLKLSHQELANLIGATRESVTVLLGNLKRDGLIGGKRQYVILTDVRRLAELVGR